MIQIEVSTGEPISGEPSATSRRDDILFRNNSTGDTWFEAISNGASAGWNQIGGSNTSYTVKT
jgi:hypothetical protein